MGQFEWMIIMARIEYKTRKRTEARRKRIRSEVPDAVAVWVM